MKVLYSSLEIRSEIIRIFSEEPGRRVAIVAFVGANAGAFLPNAKGIELYCWPKEGGTNPKEIRHLRERKAEIYFADRLHMKIYWTEKAGAIVGSANLSTNALGAGNLREFAVLVDSNDIDIDRVISSLKSKKATDSDVNQLARRHQVAKKKYPEMVPNSDQEPVFDEWWKSTEQTPFLIGWYTGYGDITSSAKVEGRTKFGHDPFDWMNVKRNQCGSGDYFLTFMIRRSTISRLNWMYVDKVYHVVENDPNRDPEYPFQAVQFSPINTYPKPFRIDSKFRKAFAAASKKFGLDRIETLRNLEPTPAFLKSLRRFYDAV